ncbi:MAG: hypothetical protein WDM96_03495 [Lacunisphaera sp.]
MDLTLAVQVNSVNRRGLDLTLSLPDDWQVFESAWATQYARWRCAARCTWRWK